MSRDEVPVDNTSKSVQVIEQKPHRLYIRYLLTKKWSPRKIRENLYKLGLSSSNDDSIERYYNIMIKPMIKKHKLGHIYQDYDSVLARKSDKRTQRFPTELNFKLELGNDVDTQINFLKFINEIECEDLWRNEFYNFYGRRENVPTDPDTGKSLMEKFNKQSQLPWSIIQSPKRYVVDELILEGLSNARIIRHMQEHHNIRIQSYEILMYRSSFFNVTMIDVREQIKFIEVERQNILFHIQNIDTRITKIEGGKLPDPNSTISDLLIEKKSLFSRLSDLDNSIRSLNAQHNEAAANRLAGDTINYEAIFAEMFAKTYDKFTFMAKQNDRDVVDPMYKLTKMMGAQYAAMEQAKEAGLKGNLKTQSELINLITDRIDELEEEDKEAQKALGNFEESNVGFGDEEVEMSDIMGVENLGQPEEDNE